MNESSGTNKLHGRRMTLRPLPRRSGLFRQLPVQHKWLGALELYTILPSSGTLLGRGV